MRTRSKFSVLELVTDHYSTLRNHANGKISVSDLVVYVGGPAAIAGVAYVRDASAQHLPEVLAAIAILTGLIFNVFVLLFDLTMRAADNADQARRRDMLKLAGELRANISYGVLLGILLTAALGGRVMFSQSTDLPPGPSALLVFTGLQMLMTIFMVLRRVRALYRAYLQVEPHRVP